MARYLQPNTTFLYPLIICHFEHENNDVHVYCCLLSSDGGYLYGCKPGGRMVQCMQSLKRYTF